MDLSDEEDFCDCGEDGASGAEEDDVGDSTSAQ